MEAEDLPLLGEPLPIEFANSLYVSADETFDFLGTPSLMRLWFDSTAATFGLHLPARARRVELEAIRELRNAIHAALDDITSDRAVASTTLAVLNRCSRCAAQHVQIEFDHHSECHLDHHRVPVMKRSFSGTAAEVLISRLATDAIELLGGPSRRLVRRCDGPDCPMFFIQQHRRRRFCHEGCSHRMRQARYYRTSIAGRGDRTEEHR